MNFDGFVYLPGNDYTKELSAPFLSALHAYFHKPVHFVQLLENRSKSLSYSQLEPSNYSNYIAASIGHKGKYVLIGISMGCLHIANFSHFYPSWCYPVMIMLEPTIMQGIYPLLHIYESERGNGEWLKELHDNPNPLRIPANEKVMDIAVSPDYNHGSEPLNIPSFISIGVVYTTKSNENKPYTVPQLFAKAEYFNYLSSRHKTYLTNLDTSHCVDTQEKYFEHIIMFIDRILRKTGLNKF